MNRISPNLPQVIAEKVEHLVVGRHLGEACYQLLLAVHPVLLLLPCHIAVHGFFVLDSVPVLADTSHVLRILLPLMPAVILGRGDRAFTNFGLPLLCKVLLLFN